jgi:ribonucleoside-triphosphate reductase
LITVQTTKDRCERFRKRKIIESLLEEVEGIPESIALNIARAVERQVKKIEGATITTAQIRELVNAQLIKRGEVKAARQYERVGIPTADIKKLIRAGNRDNANLAHNPETVHKHVADEAMKQYALNCLPEGLAEVHDSGLIHIHDLDYFAPRPLNCLQHDLRFFIRNGLKVDGTGEHTSVAGPANNIETLVNHAGQILMASQVNMSGGQSLPLLNVFMAPYVRSLEYERIKQAMQMFIFNLNMSYTSRGGQAVFSTINLEFSVPDFLKNEPAYGPGGEVVGLYGDFEEEARIIQRAITEVLLEGDSMGKPHFFPNTVYVIRDGTFDDPTLHDDIVKVHEVCAKYSTPYFLNQMTEYNGLHSDVMGCRTRLNTTWTGDWDLDTLRTGNLAYITINLPRIAYLSENWDDFYERLDKALAKAETILLIRREHGLKCLNDHKLMRFLTQPDIDGTPYYRIENTTLSFGFVGLNETLMMMGYEEGLLNDEGKGGEILQHFNDYAKDLTEETGYRWTIIATPAESTAHRFATIDRELYGKDIICSGDEGSYYYTNSSHVPVSCDVSITDRIRTESPYHTQTTGGNIFHAFLGEAHPNPEGLASLTEKICKNSEIGFFAYSGAFSFCFDCEHLMQGIEYECLECGKEDDVEIFDRITGYTQAVGHKKQAQGGWNAGKKAEFKDRKRYTL